MIWTIFKLSLGLLSAFIKYRRDKQLMDAGAAKAVLRGLKIAENAIDRARAADAAVKHDRDSVRNDPARGANRRRDK